ncbi:hypothetical protein NQ318_012140 [Aromia moschata]|uniref:Zinc finger protein ubi-d4 n=1 Tax=Aromia moschata TaxID=1265417 RepID=A0AAV8Z189_9CUCU|nr:hypothetical protein NQ318_012140 [Aromia moschata]
MAALVVPPVETNSGNRTNLEKIESFLNEAAYKEALENSVNYNTRLCIERRLRLPFIDTQTRVAQNHSALYMSRRQRIPGLLPGQIYSYPRQRWRKKRRQYLTMNSRAFARAADHMLDGETDVHNISQIENPALQDTDSKDSQLLLKDEVSKEWFYDEADMLEMDAYDEPDPDSDLDYEETYSKRKKGRRGTGRGRSGTDSPSTPGRKKGSGRGRKKAGHSFEPTPGDPDKPFACELCGARYKTRPGLTYHYGHSHKEGASDENSRDSNAPTPSAQMGGPMTSGFPGLPVGPPQGHPGGPSGPLGGPMGALGPVPPLMGGGMGEGHPANSNKADQGQVYQDSYVSFLNQTPGSQGRRGRQPNSAPGSLPQVPPISPMAGVPQSQTPPTLPPNLPPQQPPMPVDDPPMPVLMPEKNLDGGPVAPGPSEMGPSVSAEGVKKAAPSPYCDFCLGDTRENKKTGGQEELVSCADCGRSGHPTCLQFTDNMKISVTKYRWQCIECKCCSVCGNSDNDDQLLFCDDCDRGYHMYCLSPPLVFLSFFYKKFYDTSTSLKVDLKLFCFADETLFIKL